MAGRGGAPARGAMRSEQTLRGRWLPQTCAEAALFTTACCIGVPAVTSLIAGVGAGVLLADRYLQPLLIVLLLTTVAASGLTYRRHRNPVPLAVSVISGAIVYWFIYRYSLIWIVLLGAAAMIAAQVWDVVAVQSCVRRPAQAGPQPRTLMGDQRSR
jgi:MerC mercury resistance protein